MSTSPSVSLFPSWHLVKYLPLRLLFLSLPLPFLISYFHFFLFARNDTSQRHPKTIIRKKKVWRTRLCKYTGLVEYTLYHSLLVQFDSFRYLRVSRPVYSRCPRIVVWLASKRRRNVLVVTYQPRPLRRGWRGRRAWVTARK